MLSDKKKVAIVGVGMVGMSFAYALLNQNICDELVLIDINKERAWGEAADLSRGLPFAPSSMKIKAGEYSDCSDADLVVICAGAPQLPGESRRDLLQKNYKVFSSIVQPIIASGFNGVFLVASNPVDIMTQVVYTLSGQSSGGLRHFVGQRSLAPYDERLFPCEPPQCARLCDRRAWGLGVCALEPGANQRKTFG